MHESETRVQELSLQAACMPLHMHCKGHPINRNRVDHAQHGPHTNGQHAIDMVMTIPLCFFGGTFVLAYSDA